VNRGIDSRAKRQDGGDADRAISSEGMPLRLKNDILMSPLWDIVLFSYAMAEK